MTIFCANSALVSKNTDFYEALIIKLLLGIQEISIKTNRYHGNDRLNFKSVQPSITMKNGQIQRQAPHNQRKELFPKFPIKNLKYFHIQL